MTRSVSVFIGEVYPTNKNGDVTVIEVINSQKIKIQFNRTGGTTWVRTQSLKKGVTRDPLSLLDIAGYLGEGNYSYTSNKEAYQCWRNMLRRCYDPHNEKYVSYGERGVKVNKEWHNFQNFALWWEENNRKKYYKEVVYEIDKDLSGGKCYSEKTCQLIPAPINNFIRDNIVTAKQGVYKEGNIFRTKLFTVTGEYESCFNYTTESTAWEDWYNNRLRKLNYLVFKFKGCESCKSNLETVRNILADTYDQILDKVVIK